MNTYVFKKSTEETHVYSPVWESTERAEIVTCPWQEFQINPYTYAQGLITDDALVIRMVSEEKELRSCMQKVNGRVCDDSCMEFFFCPDENDARYLNIEANALGVMHIGLGEGRHGRSHPIEDMSPFNCQTMTMDGKWYLRYEIPFSVLKTMFNNVSTEIRGNFYKCGEQTGHEHYIVWNNIETPNPDYHRPEFFGRITLEI